MKKLISREGPAVGTANERRLIEKAGGESTIAKSYQTNLDGTTTMAHTRGALSRPEIITTDPDPAKPIVDDGEWTYDYNPLRSSGGGLVPDLEGSYPRNDPLKGAKTRRSGLKITSETECMLSVSKSSYDIHDKDKHRKMVRGPNYWYDKRNVVTWSSEIRVDESGDMTDFAYANKVGVVQYEDATGLHEITIFHPQPFGAEGLFFLCACMAKSVNGVRYVRVAFVNSGRIYIRDYRKGIVFATASWGYVGATVDGIQIDGIRTGRNLARFSQDGLRLVTAFDPDVLEMTHDFHGNKCLVLTIPPPGKALSITPSLHAFNVPLVDFEQREKQTSGEWKSGNVPSVYTGSFAGLKELTRTTVETGAVETFDPDLTLFEERQDRVQQLDAINGTAFGHIWYESRIAYTSPTYCEILALGFSKSGDVCGVVKTNDQSVDMSSSSSLDYHYRLWCSDPVDVSFAWPDALSNNHYISTGTGPSREQMEETRTELHTEQHSNVTSQNVYFCSSASAINLDVLGGEHTRDVAFEGRHEYDASFEIAIAYYDNSPFYARTEKTGGSLVVSKSVNLETITVTLSEEKQESVVVSAVDFVAGVVAFIKTTEHQIPGYTIYRDSKYDQWPPGPSEISLGDGDRSISIWRNAMQIAEKTVPSGTGVGYGDWWEKKKSFFAFSRDLSGNISSGHLYKAGRWYNLVRNPNEPADTSSFSYIPPNISHY